jgi:Tol biopolymer transport system component/predicted Ser/Thr protein kinase
MIPEFWQRVEELYHLVLQQDPSQRAAFIKQACSDDEEMEREIKSLLAHEEPASKFMEAPGMAVLAKAMAGERVGSMAGQQIGFYQILSLLGAGGMGEVYKARDVRLGRLVALKILPRELAADSERKRRLLQEAKAASALNHPHVVTLHDVGSAEGIDFLVMEYVAGETLDRLIPSGGLELKQALRYAIEIADAFAKAHAAGIIHRDLKPSNIMVTGEGAVKVLDFGIAKFTETFEAGEPHVTLPTGTDTGGMILGTASYMSPEQVEGKKVDARSDIFSFGAVLYEMVTGCGAFPGDSKISILSAVLSHAPEPAGKIVRGLSLQLDGILARCLNKDPVQRFQTMEDLKAALEAVKEEEHIGVFRPVKAPRLALRRGMWAVLALLLLGVGAAIWIVARRGETPEPPMTAVPLTTYPGSQYWPSFSPDGNQVAFVWDGPKQDNSDIYIKLVGSPGEPLRLTTNPAADSFPAWSPDGRTIAFLRERPTGKAAVLLIPALGGPEREVTELANGFSSIAWSPDSNSLIVTDRGSPAESFALYVVSIESGEKRKLTSPPAGFFGDAAPALSPDGNSLAFVRMVEENVCDLYVLALAGRLRPAGEPKRITFGNRRNYNPAWTPDGREIVFDSGFVDSHDLWRVPVNGSAKPQRLAAVAENRRNPAISPRSRRLAYSRDLHDSNIWRMELKDKVSPATSRSPLIASTRIDQTPAFSPDGKRIAFTSARSGNLEIWVCDADGSHVVPLTAFGGADVDSAHWSPDGQRLTFDSSAEGQWEVYVVGASGGKPPQRMTNNPANDGNPSWSHDGQWIYFDSNRTGQFQVWKMPTAGGEPEQVTRGGGRGPHESPDGKVLYFMKDIYDSALWKMPSGGGQETKVLDRVQTFADFAVTHGGLYFIPAESNSILFLDSASGKVTPIAKSEKSIGGGLAISPDARWLLYTQADQDGSDLMLVENFR